MGEDFYGKIQHLVEQHKDRVLFLGELHGGQLSNFYSMCDVLTLPSVNSTESFGMVQVEAMLCGTPVVASDIPGVREATRVTGMGLSVHSQGSPRPRPRAHRGPAESGEVLYSKNRPGIEL